MSELFFTSDLHFGHKAIIKYSTRPFKHVDEMDEKMIEQYNAVVGHTDRVYLLGDFSFYNSGRTVSIIHRLKGQKYFIRGNHDKWSDSSVVAQQFEWVKHYHELRVDDRKIVLCHFPFDTWNGAHKGSWHLHGHSHGSLRTYRGGRLDVGVDNQVADRPVFTPWHYDEIVQILTGQAYQSVDHHGERMSEASKK